VDQDLYLRFHGYQGGHSDPAAASASLAKGGTLITSLTVEAKSLVGLMRCGGKLWNKLEEWHRSATDLRRMETANKVWVGMSSLPERSLCIAKLHQTSAQIELLPENTKVIFYPSMPAHEEGSAVQGI